MELNKNVPTIRFNEFEDEWNGIPFGNIAQVRRGLTYSPKDIRKCGVKVLRSSNINEDRFCEYDDDVYVDGNAINIDFVKNNDILITAANGSSRLVGKHALINTSHEKVVHGGFMLLASSKNPFFLNASMSSEWYRKFISKNIAGGNGAIGNLNKNHLESEVILIPKESEQTQIGNFFKTLDSQITSQEQKYQKLINLKKAMLEKMFPKEGSDVPEIRFKGFTEKWEEKKLGDFGNVAMNKRIFKSETSIIGEIPFYKIGTFGSIPDSYITREKFLEYKSKYHYPQKGDVLISASGSIGRLVVYQGKEEYFQDSNIVWLNHGGKLNNKFLKQFYLIVKWNGLEGSTIKRLYNSSILSTNISVPRVEEQQKIGEYFDKLDNLIQSSQEQIKKHKNIKQALLQKMFV